MPRRKSDYSETHGKEEFTIRTRFVVEKIGPNGKVQKRFIDAINEEAALELAKKIEW